ncbi:MAG TPA: hypothetical protein VJK02_25515 [Anaerolineales bacterium]|nr:hypothetical protein [Anaerolineales bacterium]
MALNEELAHPASPLCSAGPVHPRKYSRWSDRGLAVIGLALLSAFLVGGCSVSAPSSSATDVPELQAPTGALPPTAIAEPNARVLQATPPPTVRAEPQQISPERSDDPLWAITDTMLSECSNAMPWFWNSADVPAWIAPEGIDSFGDPIPTDFLSRAYAGLAMGYINSAIWEAWGWPFPTPDPEWDEPHSPLGRYTLDMAIRILEAHPEFVEAGPLRPDARWWWVVVDPPIRRNNGRYQDPFGMLYYIQDPLPFEETTDDFEGRSCLPLFLFVEMSGIVGEGPIRNGYLFYEVGGTDRFSLDGELREVHFTFPTAQ